MFCPADYLSLPGNACYRAFCSRQLPSSPGAWMMGFNLHAFTLQTRCFFPPICMLLKDGLGGFVSVLYFNMLRVFCGEPNLLKAKRSGVCMVSGTIIFRLLAVL